MPTSESLISLLGRLQHASDPPELRDTLQKILEFPHALDQVVEIVEKRIEAGTYFLSSPLATLISRTQSSSLYEKVRDRLLSNGWDTLQLYKAQYPDPEIETILCKELFSIAKKDIAPLRSDIVIAMREVGSEAVLPTLEAILYDLEPGAKISKLFTDAYGRFGHMVANSRGAFLERVIFAIEEIKNRTDSAVETVVPETSQNDGVELVNQAGKDKRQLIAQLVDSGESNSVEFKSTFRWDLRLERKNDDVTHASLKTIAAFLNSKGGTLLIGVANDKTAVGIDVDMFGSVDSDDKFLLHIWEVIKNRIGPRVTRSLETYIDMYDGKKVCLVQCDACSFNVFLKSKGKDEKDDEFFVRIGPSSVSLTGKDLVEYVLDRFPKPI